MFVLISIFLRITFRISKCDLPSGRHTSASNTVEHARIVVVPSGEFMYRVGAAEAWFCSSKECPIEKDTFRHCMIGTISVLYTWVKFNIEIACT